MLHNKKIDVIASTCEGSGWDEAIPKLEDCFALPHKSHAGTRKDVLYFHVMLILN